MQEPRLEWAGWNVRRLCFTLWGCCDESNTWREFWDAQDIQAVLLAQLSRVPPDVGICWPHICQIFKGKEEYTDQFKAIQEVCPQGLPTFTSIRREIHRKPNSHVQISLRVSGKSSLPSLSLSLSAVHLEYKCTVVERCGQEMSRVSYSDTSSMAGKQTHNSMMFCASLTQDMLSPMTAKTFRMMSSNITWKFRLFFGSRFIAA